MVSQIGYCTNVHAGNNLETTLTNLREHAIAVKQEVRGNAPLGIGLWLSAATAEQLKAEARVHELADWLGENDLVPFTLNGFPYGDFHQAVVKHDVYKPTWRDVERTEYTFNLIEILDELLPPGMEGSISTLPLEWGSPRPSEEQLAASADALRAVARRLHELEQQEGRLIHVCIEPEPGCVLDEASDIVQFFERHLCSQGDAEQIRRYIRVCHDVCHSAVMFETQSQVLKAYQRAGILVGKVQVSSAVVVPFESIEPDDRPTAVEQLAAFAEDRYLHQTSILTSGAARPVFFQDLPEALRLVEDATQLDGQWRVHFHVPVYLQKFGLLDTSRGEIEQCLRAVEEFSDVSHFEVETYAWGVLPPELRQPTLATGIAKELRWFIEQKEKAQRR